MQPGPTRRAALGALAAAAATAAQEASRAVTPRLGIDVFSLRSQGWSPFQLLDHSAQLGAEVAHLSEVRFLGGLDDANIRRLREHADRLRLKLEVGMRSICPTSKAFDATQGTAEEQLARMVRVAQLAGSPIVRCFLGSMEDRKGPLPLEAHIENAAKVLRASKARVQDAGVKVAVENHAGDLQARELKLLVDEAGRDFVGVCLDSGNPLWTLEDPHLTLETLAPYALTSHVRDSSLWRVPEGVALAWTRMGEGNIDIDRWVRRYQELCPGKTVSLEIIVTQPRVFAVNNPGFWQPGYRDVRAGEFMRFLRYADQGRALDVPKVPKEQVAEKERADLAASAAHLKPLLARS